jgi:carbamoylphosphate synthase small subunit
MVLCDATDDVDTRAITRRLREDGSLIGVLSTDNSKTDEELLQMSKSWDIVGRDMTIREYYSNVFKTGITCL